MRRKTDVYKRQLQGFGVDSDTLFARFIHQIEAEYGVRHDLEYLQDQNQIAFQAGRVRNKDGCVRIAGRCV